MNVHTILRKLKMLGDPNVAASVAEFGIISANVYGVSVPQIRAIGQEIGTDHRLAQELWKTKVLEARILASVIADPKAFTEQQMEQWVSDFDSWAVCDACCLNVFDKTPFAWSKVLEWSSREPEYVKRAAFALMAVLAVRDKKAPDKSFIDLLPVIQREAWDERNYVKKAVNWALRQIGKRNLALNVRALKAAHEIRAQDTPAARWIAADAIRELSSDAVQRKLAMVQRPALRN